MSENAQRPLHEQKSIQGVIAPGPESEEKLERQEEPEKRQKRSAWPPSPRPRAPQGPPKVLRILTIVLASLLVASGLSFIIYATTNQYNLALGAVHRFNTNATARSALKSQATLVDSLAATAQPLATTQAQIVASATAQDIPSATAQAQSDEAAATAAALGATLTQDTTATPTVDDPLSDTTSKNQWDTGFTDNNATGCNFVDSGYQAQESRQGFLQPCFAEATNFSNFVYQVSMTITSGTEGGIIFRGDKTKGQYYLFRIDINGNYALDLYNGSTYSQLVSGTSTAISTGPDGSNDLTVIANKNTLDLFVNQNYVNSVSDQTLSAGQIGVAVIDTRLPAAVDFSNAEVWNLP